MKLVSPTKALAEQHYADLKARPFFGALVDCAYSFYFISFFEIVFEFSRKS
jgi:nucleoside diphosphate kinase